jgi:integrase
VDAGILGTNPAEHSKPPRPNRTRAPEIVCWEPHELAKFLQAVKGDRLEAAWRVAAMTGMRRGEVLGLRWGDIDLDTSRIAVRNAIVSVAYEVLESTPKSHQARVIDLDPETNALLLRHRERQNDGRETAERVVRASGLAFRTEDGIAIHPHSFSQAFTRIIERAGLRRIRLHDLRHTLATIAVKAGVPVKVISERLGYESPASTLKQYAHVVPGMQAEAAELVASTVDARARAG